MKFLAGLLFHNFVYKLIAVLVAAVLWAAVQGSRSVEESLDLPIELTEISDSLVVVDQSAVEVNVRLVGSRAALRAARRELTSYPISLDGVSAGEARFPILTESLALPPGGKVVARSPSTVVLRIEPVARKKVPVRVDLVGEPANGAVLISVDVSPREVILAGASSSIRRLREVLTESVDLSEIEETTVREISLAPLAGSLVWRAEEDQTPIQVQIRLENGGPPEPTPPPGLGSRGR